MKLFRVPIELLLGAIALALTAVVCATFASCAPGGEQNIRPYQAESAE